MDAETFLNVFTDNKPINDIYIIQQYSTNMSKSSNFYFEINEYKNEWKLFYWKHFQTTLFMLFYNEQTQKLNINFSNKQLY
jgi:hypothetical protein